MNPQLESFRYDDAIVRKFLWATFVWGLIGMTVGLLIALQLAVPALNLDIPWLSFGRLRPLHTNAVIFAFAGNAFFTGAYYSSQRLLKTRMFSDALSADPLLGLAAHHRAGGAHPAPRLHAGQGIRRARVADRHPDRRGVGRVRHQLLRHPRQAARAAPVRRALVLHRQHRDGGHPAHLQQPVGAGRAAEELLDLRRGPGRLHAVVVRPQRRGLLPHHAVPRADVLLPPEGGGQADLQLPPLDPALLDHRLPLHLGRAAPPALHRPPGMGVHPRHDLLRHALDALVGRHDQRPPDPPRRLAEGGGGPDPQVLRGGHHRLRHVHLRGADALGAQRQRAGALHRLDHRPRPHRRPRLERVPDVRHDLLAGAPALPDEAPQPEDGRAALLAGHLRDHPLRRPPSTARASRRA